MWEESLLATASKAVQLAADFSIAENLQSAIFETKVETLLVPYSTQYRIVGTF